MLRVKAIFLFFLLNLNSFFSQNKDSLMAIIKTRADDTTKLKTYSKFIEVIRNAPQVINEFIPEAENLYSDLIKASNETDRKRLQYLYADLVAAEAKFYYENGKLGVSLDQFYKALNLAGKTGNK